MVQKPVSHSKDGILSSTDFNQWWGDLEGVSIYTKNDTIEAELYECTETPGLGSKQGEQIAQQAEQLAQHCEQMAQQGEQMEIQRKHIEQQEDTTALIEEDVREGTFVATKAVTNGLLLLKQNGVLLITGYAGTGKSRIGRHVLHMFCTENKSFKCMKLTLAEWDNMTNREGKKDNKEETIDNRADKVVLLLDDIFGETNCIYNGEKDTPILDKIYAYVCKGNIKVIITIRDTVKRQCQEMFDSHRLFKFNFIDLSSDMYLLSQEEKHTILMKYMNTVRQSDYIKSKGFVDRNGHLILKSNEVSNISRGNPVKGFPLVVYQFVHNDKYFKLGSKFFDRPTEAMLEEMNAIRRKAINENCINPDDNSCGTEISKVINAIYGGTTEMKKCHILDAVKDLKGSYLVNIPNQRSYKLHHPTLQESVILSFAQIDEENIDKIIPLISWSFFLKMEDMYGTMGQSLRKLNFGNPSLSSLPLKWMIETFPDQKLDDPNFILRTACKYQMFDTVEYVASKCKTFDEISCLQAFVDMPMSRRSKVSFNRELFSFLLKS
ncbi:unnamed protein product [Mytilus edulis]|uniref:Novel STAND NTPase 3 domain-containing protein n=1 Tax=Mytilus edulis TaxID=6550 RepID=A0A8S3T8L8_MYTED|nr:unnamed protein product [Mytilus edulis]